MEKPELQALPQLSDRMTFLYLEHCKLNRQDGAITVLNEDGIMHVPSGMISVLMLGPGTEVSHRAMELIGDAGVSVCWVGEHGVRFYAGGRPLTRSSRLILRQAEAVSNQRKHLQVVRTMYEMRFPGENVEKLTLQQLRGREGSRIRKVYKEASAKWGVPWNGRVYDPTDYSASDPVNQALSAGHACLYGLAHAVICGLGLSPALGFVHIGHENSFVYDVADLYKAEITIPLAFEIAASEPEELERAVRRRVRDEMSGTHLLERMVRDLKHLFPGGEEEDEIPQAVQYLWDDKTGTADYGRLYREELPE